MQKYSPKNEGFTSFLGRKPYVGLSTCKDLERTNEPSLRYIRTGRKIEHGLTRVINQGTKRFD